MTTTRISPAGISGLVGLVHDLRPEWDRRGIAAAVHRLADHIPAAPLALAFIRGAVDPANETPAAVTYLDNRAWTDWWPKCENHPEERRRRTNGQCAGCWADANAARPRQPAPAEPAHPLREALAALGETR